MLKSKIITSVLLLKCDFREMLSAHATGPYKSASILVSCICMYWCQGFTPGLSTIKANFKVDSSERMGVDLNKNKASSMPEK